MRVPYQLLTTTILFLMLWQVDARELRVVTEDLPPYQLVENGQVTGGLSYHIMQEVLRRAEVDPVHEVMPWARAYRTALERDNTLIYSMIRSDKREPLFHWIGRLQRIDYQFYGLRSNQQLHVNTVEDALNYTVVSIRNSFEASSLKQLGFELGRNLILVVDYASAWEILELGRADLIFADAATLTSITSDPALFSKYGDRVKSRDLYVAANLNTRQSLISELRKAFASVKSDPQFSHLFDISSTSTTTQSVDPL
ncbi:transporter substrate-binding domain-containing protein [Lacimicrobium sp. SS2-24]|uniref:substrate-binding periplasmic protein n=1 Tax=Lacimicrobium sp. SS2-24 TaxID=2005569 RepID=UPI000B4ABC14|nr:transporter substrate-binding domain-containing protein [Lacimicrobium sp. SS2-24]